MIYELGLGSNLGDRPALLQSATDALRAAGCDVTGISRVYETEPVGGPEQGPYLNAVVRVVSDRDPHAMLGLVHEIETAAQRVRVERWGPRTLDIDILRCSDDDGTEVHVEFPDLEIPHPRMFERAFVLVPLHDLDDSVGLDGIDTSVVWAAGAELR